jgi:hypothetical protein
MKLIVMYNNNNNNSNIIIIIIIIIIIYEFHFKEKEIWDIHGCDRETSFDIFLVGYYKI